MDKTVLSSISIGALGLLAVVLLSSRSSLEGRSTLMFREREEGVFQATTESVQSFLESKSSTGWTEYGNLLESKPRSVKINEKITTEAFARPAPSSLNPNLVTEQHDNFNFLQDLSANPLDENIFECPADSLYVAEIPNCFVEDVSGLMYDIEGNLYHDADHFFTRMDELPQPNPATMEIRTGSTYVNVIQRYSNMYYHFVVEILPRIILAKPYLDSDPEAKLLIWDTQYVRNYLEYIGISQDRIEPFDPFVRYYAKRVIYPTPTPRITPCKESLELTRQTLNIKTLPEEERDLIIYLSRESEINRQVSDEKELLESIEEMLPNEKIVVFKSQQDVAEIISLFQRAKMVLGPHGAGFSHIVFTAPNTKVVEMSFAKFPPLMFWHISRALDLDYWLVPIPNSYWTQPELEIPLKDMLSVVKKSLSQDSQEESQDKCKAGYVRNFQSECIPCPAGTFKALDDENVCVHCFPGSVSPEASSYCAVCISGTYEDNLTECKPCPRGLISWLPGSSGVESCITQEEIDRQQQIINAEMLNSGFLEKLDPRVSTPIFEARSISAMNPYQPAPPMDPPLPPPADLSPPPFSPPAFSPPASSSPAFSPPAFSPPAFSPPPLADGEFVVIFEDSFMFPVFPSPFGQFGVSASVSNPLQVTGGQFMVGPFSGSSSLILDAGPFSQYSVSSAEPIPANILLSFYITIASGDPAFLALTLTNELPTSDSTYELSTPLAFLDEDLGSETLPLQQWVRIELSLGSSTLEPLFDSIGIFYQGPGPILYALDQITYQILPETDMSGVESIILDDISPPWILESGVLLFEDSETAVEGDAVGVATVIQTNLIQLTRESPFIAVGESPAIRFSIRAGNEVSAGQTMTVIVELAELHEDILGSDDISMDFEITESFVEIEIDLAPGDAVTEIVLTSFSSVIPVSFEIDNLRLEPN